MKKMLGQVLALSGLAVLLAGAATNDVLKSPKASKAPTEPTVITSKHLNVDYANNVTVLDGDVLVVDPRITVRADKVVVYSANKSAGTNTTGAASNTLATATSGTSRTIQRIVADGSVVITIDDKKSTSDHAEYFAEEGKVILTGNPHVQSPDGSVAGKQITFWRGSQKMDVVADETATNRTRLVIYPEDQRKKKDGE